MSVLDVISAVSLAMGVLLGGGGFAQLRKHWRNQVIRDERMDRVCEAVLGTDTKAGLVHTVDGIVAQLNPNSGTSLRDAVDRADSNSSAAVAEVAKLRKQFERHSRSEAQARRRLRESIDGKADK